MATAEIIKIGRFYHLQTIKVNKLLISCLDTDLHSADEAIGKAKNILYMFIESNERYEILIREI